MGPRALPPAWAEVVDAVLARGLGGRWLVTGPGGSGKTPSLDALDAALAAVGIPSARVAGVRVGGERPLGALGGRGEGEDEAAAAATVTGWLLGGAVLVDGASWLDDASTRVLAGCLE